MYLTFIKVQHCLCNRRHEIIEYSCFSASLHFPVMGHDRLRSRLIWGSQDGHSHKIVAAIAGVIPDARVGLFETIQSLREWGRHLFRRCGLRRRCVNRQSELVIMWVMIRSLPSPPQPLAISAFWCALDITERSTDRTNAGMFFAGFALFLPLSSSLLKDAGRALRIQHYVTCPSEGDVAASPLDVFD